MAKVKCPLMDENIDDEICFDIHMVVDGMAPEYTAPKKVIQTERFRDICLSCPNHKND